MRSNFSTRVALALLLPLVFATGTTAQTANAPDRAVSEKELAYGDVVEIAPNARLVVGRKLDLQARSPDIANVLLYKSGSSLVVVDSGATTGFVGYLDRAAEQLRPYDKVVLITTHGHPDHVGNNAWVDTLGVPATHLISAHDLALMRDQVGYFAPRFEAARPYLPGLPPGKEFAQELIAEYGDLKTETKSLTVFEALPIEEITIGQTLWNGWRLLDGNVIVLQTSGHTQGHVAVFLPALKLLHLADETTGYYQAFGGSPAANLLTLERSAKAAKEGAVELVTDGHTFEVLRGPEAAEYLDGLVRTALRFDAAVVRILNQHLDGMTIPELVAEVGRAPELSDAPTGANPIPVLSVMQVLNKLKELGVAQPDDPEGLVKLPR